MKAGLMALVTVVALACSQSPQPTPSGNGVRVTGAVNSLYPVTSGGTCLSFDLPSGRQLAFSGNPEAAQPGIGWVIGTFDGPGTYSDVRWPAEGHSSISLSVGSKSVGTRLWRAYSGTIVVTNLDASAASGTLKASGMREVGGSTTVNATGSWACRMLAVPNAPSPSPSHLPNSPLPPVGSPVPRHVLAPATVLPVAALCTTPIDQYADGSAGPTFCRDGAINVAAWEYFAPIDAHVMSLGPNATVADVKGAINADFGTHSTNVIESDGYELATAYYGWKLDFDYWKYVTGGA